MKKQMLILGALVLAGIFQTTYSTTDKRTASFTKKVTQNTKDFVKRVENLIEKKTGEKLSKKQQMQLLLMIQHPGAENRGKTQKQINAEPSAYFTPMTSQCCCCSQCETVAGQCYACEISCERGAVAPKLNNQKRCTGGAMLNQQTKECECPEGSINVGSVNEPNCVANPDNCPPGELC